MNESKHSLRWMLLRAKLEDKQLADEAKDVSDFEPLVADWPVKKVTLNDTLLGWSWLLVCKAHGDLPSF